MKNTSKPWLLGSMLLLPGLVIAVGLQLTGNPMIADTDETIRGLSLLPAPSAGSSDIFSGDPNDDWNDSLFPSAATVSEEFIRGGVPARLTLQVSKYRFRRDEVLSARTLLAMDMEQAPRGVHLSAALTTRQGNLVADISPEIWQSTETGILGRIAADSDNSWPRELRLVVTMKAPEMLPAAVSTDIELFSPKATVSSVGTPYQDQNDWVLPLEVDVYAPGILVVSAQLTEDSGTLIGHLHSRSRVTDHGILELRLRRDLLDPEHYQQNLILSEISVRHIADSLNAELGWGDSKRAHYVLPPLGKLEEK